MPSTKLLLDVAVESWQQCESPCASEANTSTHQAQKPQRATSTTTLLRVSVEKFEGCGVQNFRVGALEGSSVVSEVFKRRVRDFRMCVCGWRWEGLASFNKGRVVNGSKSAGLQAVHIWCGFQGLG